MSSPERLIEELRGGAGEGSPGEFTLDREQARTKLRQFQFADPRRYVLFLVEAAVLRGATRIDFRIDADDVICHFDGPPLTAHDFDELYGSMFVRSDDDLTRARRALALGLNAAMALNPRWIRVDTGDGTAAVRFEMRADRPDAIAAAPEPVAGTRIHVKSRFRAGLAVAFVRNLAGSVAEERWLRWNARFCRVPVTLDGKPVSFGFEDPFLAEAAGRAPIEGPGLAGAACFDPTRDEPPRVGLLYAGVLVSWYRPEGPPGAFGVVESRDFHRDASFSDVVRDAAFERAIAAWREAADTALAGALERVRFDGSDPAAGRARAAVFEVLRRRRDRFVSHWNVRGALDPVSAALARAPVWNMLQGAPAVTQHLLAEVAAGRRVRYTSGTFEGPPGDAARDVVRTTRKDEADLLEALFPGRTEDATPELNRAVERERARLRFLERRTEATLPPRAGYRVIEPLRGDGVAGEVGVGGSGAGAMIRFVRDGCLLVEKRVNLPFAAPPHILPIEAVLSGDFAPNETWDDVAPDAVLGRAVAALLEGLERAMRRLCAEEPPAGRILGDPRRPLVLSWLRGALDPECLRNALIAFGVHPDRMSAVLPSAVRDSSPIRLGVGKTAEGSVAGGVHPAARFPLVDRLGWPAVDLATIDAEVRARGRVSFLVHPPLEGGRPEELLLTPSPAELEVLRLVFGSEALHDATAEWQARARRVAFERQLPEPLGPDPRGFASVSFRGEGLEGYLSLLGTPSAGADDVGAGALCPMRLRILDRGRFLGERTMWMVAGPLAATVNGRDVRANAEWTDVEDPAFEARAGAAAAEALVPLLERLGAERPRLPAGRREIADRLLIEAACAPFPAPAFADAWAAARAALPFDEARAVLLRLLSWVGRMPMEDVETALEIALEANVGDGSPPAVLPERVVTCLTRDDRPAVEGEPARAYAAWLAACADDPVWPMPEALRRVTLFRTLGDRWVSPVEMAARLAAGESVGWVGPEVSVEPDGGQLVLRLDAGTQALLARALGPRRLVDCNEETRRRQRLRRLESVPRLARVALAEGEALQVEPLVAARVTGEVGLAAEPDAGPSVLTICSDRRPLARVEGLWPLAVRAIVNDDELVLEAGTANPSPGEPERLARLCEPLVPRLIEGLVARWPALNEGHRAAAWRHLLDALASGLPPFDGRPRPEGRAHLRAAAGVRGFRMRSGESSSLTDLSALAERLGGVFVVPAGARPEDAGGDAQEAASDASFLVVAEPWEEERLQRLFPRVVDWRACSGEERQVVRRRSELQALPDPKSVAKLVKTKFDRGGLRGLLFLPRDPAMPLEASFGCAGLELGRGPASPLLPCAGIVHLPDELLEPALRGGWSVDLLESEAREALERAAVQLYRMLLAGRFDHAEADEERVRDLLADAVVRLQRAAVEAGGHLKGEAGLLLRDLKPIPLVRRGGKRVRLDKLLRSRPADLEPLGLWPRRPEVTVATEGDAASSAGAPIAFPAVAASPAEAFVIAEPSAAPAAPPTEAGGPGGAGTAGVAAASPAARPEAPAPESPAERERRFLARLSEELQRIWPKEDRGKVRVNSLVMVEEAGGLPGRYGLDVVAIARRHPLVRAALASFEEDLVPLWLLASFLATQANLEFTRITDDGERATQAALVERVAEGAGAHAC